MKFRQYAWRWACIGLFFPGQLLAQTWTPTGAPTNHWQAVMCSADGSKLFAASGGFAFPPGRIYSSTNGGLTWITNSAPTLYWSELASSADCSHLIAAASTGIFLSTNYGETWQSNSVGFNGGYRVSSSADGSRLAVAATKLIFASTNGGANWNSNSFANEITSLSCSADGSRLMAGNSLGNVVVSTNSGATWSPAASVHGYLAAIASSADGSRWVAAARPGGSGSGFIFSSTNLGASWTTDSAPANPWQSLASSADGTGLIACGYDRIYTSTNSGLNWLSNSFPSQALFSGVLSSVACSADGSRLFAAISSGRIWVAQNPVQPQIGISSFGGNTKIFWTVPSTNVVLQQSSDLQNWSDITNPANLNLTNLNDEVPLTLPVENTFFRLTTP